MMESDTLFGEALRDAYLGQQTGDFLVLSDDGKDFPVDLDFYFSSEPEEAEIQVLSHISGRILDVGCGCGRIAKYLQDKGLDVTGIDIDPIAVEVAVQRGCRQIYAGTLDDLDRDQLFDTILLLNRTLSSMGTIDQIAAVLTRCREHAAPHAHLIFDSYEVREDIAQLSPGITLNTLRFSYNGQVGSPFTRTFFDSSVARGLVARAGWKEIDILIQSDRFWMTSCRM